jgi:hypothetical protein
MARGEVTGKKLQQTDISDSIPFSERVFTSRQAREILAEGKTKFFQESLPKLEAYLDGNKLKITGKSIQALIASRLKGGRQPRPVPQRIQQKLGESGAATKARRIEARP